MCTHRDLRGRSVLKAIPGLQLVETRAEREDSKRRGAGESVKQLVAAGTKRAGLDVRTVDVVQVVLQAVSTSTAGDSARARF